MSSNWTELSSDAFANPELSKQGRMVARKQTKLYEAVEPASEFAIGKKSGDKVQVKIFGRISGTAESALSEFTPIPFGDLPEYSVAIQAYQRGLAVPITGIREDLDRIDVRSAVIKGLTDHAARTLNKVCKDTLTTGQSFTYSALTASTYSFTTNGTPGGSANSAFGMFHLRKMRLEAMKNNMPMADGSNYWFFGSPRIQDDLLGDTGTNAFVDISKYDPAKIQGLLAGEIGTVGNTRIVIDNDQLTDTIGTGAVFGMGFLCGSEAAHEVLVYPMHFRAQSNLGGDFGRQSALCWLSLLGVKSVWSYAAHGQANYIAYTST